MVKVGIYAELFPVFPGRLFIEGSDEKRQRQFIYMLYKNIVIMGNKMDFI